MWIETTRFTSTGRPVVRQRNVKGVMVEFSDTGRANVPEDIGMFLVNNYDEYQRTETKESEIE